MRLKQKMNKNFNISSKNPFFLNAENLETLFSILTRYVPEKTYVPLSINVTRIDGSSDVYSSPEDIGKESNTSSKKIDQIILSSVSSDLNYSIKFNKQNGSSFSLEGNDHNQLKLLYSEINECLELNITKKVFWGIKRSHIITLYTVILIIFFADYSCNILKYIKPSISYMTAINADDTSIKLNYLIEQTYSDNNASYGAIMGYLFSVLGYVFFFDRLASWSLRWLHPYNVFLFGAEIERINDLKARRLAFYFGVPVALIIALGSGFYFTK